MSNLTLSTIEIKMPNRRVFLKGTAITLTTLYVAPTIIKAENLMHINTLANRLLWAFKENYEMKINPESSFWTESGINASQAWNSEFMNKWKDQNSTLHYELRRRAEVRLRTEESKRKIFNAFVDKYDEYRGLWIPASKKAELIV